MGPGSSYPHCSKKYPVPLLSEACSVSGGEKEESEGTTTGGEGVVIPAGGGGNGRTGVPNRFRREKFSQMAKMVDETLKMVHEILTWNKPADDNDETRIFSDERQIDVLQAVGEQNSLVSSPDGTRLAAGGDDGHLRVVERPSLKRSQPTPRVPLEKQTISVPGLENDHKNVVVGMRTDQQWRSGIMRLCDLFFELQPARRLRLKEWTTLVPALSDWLCTLQQTLGLCWKEGTILVVGSEKDTKDKLVKCIGNFKFQAFDLGSHPMGRRVLKDYYAKVDGMVFLVNAADTEKFPDLKDEVNELLSDDSRVPILILGNFSDDLCGQVGPNIQRTGTAGRITVNVGPPAPEDELCDLLGLRNYRTGKGKVNLGEANKRPVEVFMWRTVTKVGYEEGFKCHKGQKMGCEEGLKWLFQNMN